MTDKQIELVQNFAAQAVIAIENARLLNELHQRTDDLSEALEQQTATSEVLRVISSSPGELGPVFQTMLENAAHVCEAKFGNIFRLENGAMQPVASLREPKPLTEFFRKGPHRPHEDAPIMRVAKTKQLVHVADFATERAYIERNRLAIAAVELGGIRTLLVVPMLKENELIGALAVYRQEVRPFTDKQIDLVTNFAARPSSPSRTRACSTSCARSVAAADRHRRRAQGHQPLDLRSASRCSRRWSNRRPVCATPTRAIIATERWCVPARGDLRLPAEFKRIMSEHIPSRRSAGASPDAPLLEGRTVHIPDVRADPEYTLRRGQKDLAFRTMLGVPLLREGMPIGVLAWRAPRCGRSPTSRSSWSPPSPTRR